MGNLSYFTEVKRQNLITIIPPIGISIVGISPNIKKVRIKPNIGNKE